MYESSFKYDLLKSFEFDDLLKCQSVTPNGSWGMLGIPYSYSTVDQYIFQEYQISTNKLYELCDDPYKCYGASISIEDPPCSVLFTFDSGQLYVNVYHNGLHVQKEFILNIFEDIQKPYSHFDLPVD